MSNSGKVRVLEPSSDYERFESDPRRRRLLTRVEAKTEMLNLIDMEMDQQGISIAQMARKMKVPLKKLRRAFEFEGDGLTVEMFADMLWVLNLKLKISVSRRPKYARTYPMR